LLCSGDGSCLFHSLLQPLTRVLLARRVVDRVLLPVLQTGALSLRQHMTQTVSTHLESCTVALLGNIVDRTTVQAAAASIPSAWLTRVSKGKHASRLFHASSVQPKAEAWPHYMTHSSRHGDNLSILVLARLFQVPAPLRDACSTPPFSPSSDLHVLAQPAQTQVRIRIINCSDQMDVSSGVVINNGPDTADLPIIYICRLMQGALYTNKESDAHYLTTLLHSEIQEEEEALPRSAAKLRRQQSRTNSASVLNLTRRKSKRPIPRAQPPPPSDGAIGFVETPGCLHPRKRSRTLPLPEPAVLFRWPTQQAMSKPVP
jgi:hypothetical protein